MQNRFVCAHKSENFFCNAVWLKHRAQKEKTKVRGEKGNSRYDHKFCAEFYLPFSPGTIQITFQYYK